MRKSLLNLVPFVVSLVLTLAFCEGVVRLFYPYFANYNMEMWRYFAELKQPLDRPNLPFVHFPNRKGSYYGVEIATNSLGFRDHEFPLEKPQASTRVLLLGDSQTLGWGVRFDDTMAKRLERSLGTSCEVINMGTGNYNSIMEVELLKWKGLPLKPDAVVLVYFVNDAEPTPRISRLEYSIKKRSYLLAFAYDRYVRYRPLWNEGLHWQTYYTNLYRPDQPSLIANRQALNELATICRDNGIRLLIVNYPDLHQLRDYPLQAATDYIASFAEEQDVPLLDLLPSLADCDPKTLWVSREDTHGNAETNRIAAEAMLPFIEQHLDKRKSQE